MSRAERRCPVGAQVGCISDDLVLTREAGGFAEAHESQLLGTLAIMGLDHPTGSEVDHARAALAALTRQALERIRSEYPMQRRESNQSAIGKRLRQPWQAVAADSLQRILLAASGTKGMVVDIRNSAATALFDLHVATVKRYEDKLIQTVLAPRIFDRLTSDPAKRRGSRRESGDDPAVGDPLWPYLGASEAELAAALLHNGRIPGAGFDAQEYGMHEPSRASTGMVTYALAMTPTIDDEVISEIYDEILGWITPGGVLPRRHGSDLESTWTESQCLLALTVRPYLVDGEPGPIRLADSLLRQQEDGGWSYRSGGRTKTHLIWSFYPLLALQRAVKADWLFGLRYRDAADRAAADAVNALATADTVMDRLLGLAVIHLATTGSDATQWRETFDHGSRQLSGDVSRADAEQLVHVTITDERQPLWHARINPALLYLCARRVVGPTHDFTQAIAERLLGEYDRVHQGWTNSTQPWSRPYTWTTAIALRSCQLLRADLRLGTASIGPRGSAGIGEMSA